MKKYLLLLLVCITLPALSAVRKGNVRVLYVGGSSNLETTMNKDIGEEVLQKSIAERSAAWLSFLKEYFKDVTSVDGKDYQPDMSEKYDVTVLDGKFEPISKRVVHRDADGKYLYAEEAVYFPDDFDGAVITIADMGNELGRGSGIKNDWYCLCLAGDAHSWVKDHPIFRGPFKVDLKTEMKPSPEYIFHYQYFFDEPLPQQLEMWTVQVKDHQNTKGFRVGMVARPWGYTDSPDCEYISSGVCDKTVDAVAIGRHANFFHWGFSGDPTVMTAQAKAVFANAVVYMKQFKGTTPLARKYNERISTRSYIKERLYLSTEKAWKERVASDEKWQKELRESQEAAREKMARGESLTAEEKQLLQYSPQPPMTYDQMLQRYQKDVYEQLGNDEKAYAGYFKDNYPYFYTDPDKTYELFVDEDAKRLGIDNHDLQLINTAIGLWESGKEVEMAQRILRRYTLCRFSTAAEWRQWYETYKDRLFFTESGGWLWLVNTRDRHVAGNDYGVWKKELADRRRMPQIKGQTTHDDPVLFSSIVRSVSGDEKEVVILGKIHPGYHIYAKVSENDAYIPTTIEIVPEGNCQLKGDLVTPLARNYAGGIMVYEDEIIFRQGLTGSGPGKVRITIEYQCCDDHICLPPQTITTTIDI